MELGSVVIRRQCLYSLQRQSGRHHGTRTASRHERYASSFGGVPFSDQLGPPAEEDEANGKPAQHASGNSYRATGYKMFENAATTSATLIVLGVCDISSQLALSMKFGRT